MAFRIDKTPPAPTGDPQKDIQNLSAWCNYLQEQLNFYLVKESKKEGK